MEATVFTPTQQHLLKMFAYDDSEERMCEVMDVVPLLSIHCQPLRCRAG